MAEIKGGKRKRKKAVRAEDSKLNREVIIEAALEQIDKEGLDSFSLRNLADRLGVYPTAIYWYVPNRNELMAQVVALILDRVNLARRRRSWQQHLRDLFGNFRSAVREHPNAAPLIGAQLVSNSTLGFAFIENLLAVLSRAGLKGLSLVGAYNSVVAALVGFVAQEFAPIPSEDPVIWQMSVQERLLSVNPELYPTLAANIALLSNHAFILRWQNGVDAPLDDSFGIYVDLIIRGIEGLIPD